MILRISHQSILMNVNIPECTTCGLAGCLTAAALKCCQDPEAMHVSVWLGNLYCMAIRMQTAHVTRPHCASRMKFAV